MKTAVHTIKTPSGELLLKSTMAKGKILHILNYYSPHLGGIEDVCKSIVDGTPEFERKVLCYNDINQNAREYVDGVEVIRAGLWKETARQQISLHFPAIYRRLLREYQPDIIQLHVPNPLTSAIVLTHLPRRTRLILHWHSDITVHRNIHFCYSPIEKWMLRRADAIIATSPNYIKASPYLQPHAGKCTVIPNVVSQKKLDTPCAQEDIERLHKQYGDDIVLFLGRHVPYKGLEYLIEAIPKVTRSCTFLICGKGPETDRLKAMADGLPNVVFLGRIADEQLSTYMRAAKIFAFPSITKNEAFGIALAEAMYYGAVPVTFTIDGSGVNWVNLADVTGLEVPNRDTTAYAAAIDRLIGDDELRERFATAARKRITDNFLLEHIHGKLIELYDRLLNR